MRDITVMEDGLYQAQIDTGQTAGQYTSLRPHELSMQSLYPPTNLTNSKTHEDPGFSPSQPNSNDRWSHDRYEGADRLMCAQAQANTYDVAKRYRRKANRAAQACNSCRQRKVKCTEARPTCGNCELNDYVCDYNDLPSLKPSQSMGRLESLIVGLESRQADQIERAKDIILAELRQKNVRDQLLMPLPVLHSQGSELVSKSTNDAAAHGTTPWQITLERPKKRHHDERTSSQAHDTSRLNVLAGELSIPVDHDTAAHDLRAWPEIESFFHGIQRNYVERGEAHNHLDLYGDIPECPSSRPMGAIEHRPKLMPSPRRLRYSTEELSTSFSSKGSAPFMNDPAAARGTKRRCGPAAGCSNGLLDIDETTAWKLYNSYIDHIHAIQPFVDRAEVRSLVSEFVARRCSDIACCSSAPDRIRSQSTEGTKKRKVDATSASPARSFLGDADRECPGNPIPRTARSALLLLIFALGKISLHKGPLSSCTATLDSTALKSHASWSVSDSTSQTASDSFGSDALWEHSSDEQSKNATCSKEPRMIDVLPGADYFSQAVSILGELHGRNSLVYIQAALLAGLYLGQLAFVYDSWKWIHTACVAWLMLLKENGDDIDVFWDCHRLGARREMESQLLAFWSCLILESDILAELSLVPSGISKFEDIMPGPPDDARDDEGDKELRLFFAAQVHLRKIGNRAHTALYSRRRSCNGWSVLTSRDLEEMLLDWRKGLPQQLCWQDTDPPARDVNAARLRGKYWGIRNIINRPYLRQTLLDSRSGPAAEDHGMTGQDRSKVFAKAVESLESILQSTIAFDGIPGMHERLIVTNIFGTAQAQFGNMLVSAAACMSPAFTGVLPVHQLLPFLERTCEFLRHLAPLSPTMSTNLQILKAIIRRLSQG